MTPSSWRNNRSHWKTRDLHPGGERIKSVEPALSRPPSSSRWMPLKSRAGSLARGTATYVADVAISDNAKVKTLGNNGADDLKPLTQAFTAADAREVKQVQRVPHLSASSRRRTALEALMSIALPSSASKQAIAHKKIAKDVPQRYAHDGYSLYSLANHQLGDFTAVSDDASFVMSATSEESFGSSSVDGLFPSSSPTKCQRRCRVSPALIVFTPDRRGSFEAVALASIDCGPTKPAPTLDLARFGDTGDRKAKEAPPSSSDQRKIDKGSRTVLIRTLPKVPQPNSPFLMHQQPFTFSHRRKHPSSPPTSARRPWRQMRPVSSMSTRRHPPLELRIIPPRQKFRGVVAEALST
ncbi:unnamed protein product [Jaminaea pallidilutea]